MALWYLKILYGIFIFLKISFSVINVLIGSSSIKTMFIIKVQKYGVETHKIQCKINSENFITNHYPLIFFFICTFLCIFGLSQTSKTPQSDKTLISSISFSPI